MIKQMTKQGEAFFPQTTTSAVIDEATGKTLDAMLPLCVDVFGIITQEMYDALDEAIDSGRQILARAGSGYSAMPAVGMRGTDGDGVVIFVQVYTWAGVTVVPFIIHPESLAETIEGLQWRMIKAGQGVDITEDGTLDCTLIEQIAALEARIAALENGNG